MISYSEAQALALITDPGTLKRGQELLKPAKWANLGRTETAAWGECAGSGSKPYLTGIDLTEPAFKCSCPSRVFPCKHGAGLLLLMARQPELLAGTMPPAWLTEWLEKRQQTQLKKADKPPAPSAAAATERPANEAVSEAAPVSEVPADAPTAETPFSSIPAVDSKRLARMAAGAEELTAWLEDLMRAGLASLDKKPTTFWESQAARLVDNQLPGLAATVRELATLRHAHVDWPTRLLGRLGELCLLARAFQHLPGRRADVRAEVLQQVGVSLKKEDLLATAVPVADAWRVLGQFRWEEERLTARRTWLHGRDTGRTALVLEFSFGGQPFNTPFMPRGAYLGELVFYPGLLPLRAAPVSVKFDGTVPASVVPTGQSIRQLLDDYAQALARQPWLREWPATLTQVQPTPAADGRWLLHHATETGTLPLRFAEENTPWQLLAVSGGQPLTLFGEWDGAAFRPLDSWVETAPSATSLHAPFSKKEGTRDTFLPESVKESPSQAGASFLERKLGGEGAPGGEVPAWPQLLRIALLGTRQSGEAIPAFPTPADTQELQLLLAAGTLALMRKAGYQPAAAAGPPLAPAPSELLPVIGPKGTDYLHQMLVNGLHLELLPDYLTRLGARDRLVPPAVLVPLLHHATRSADTRAALAPVLGSRGHWLASLNPDWAKLTNGPAPAAPAGADTTVWDTGTLGQRRAWLTERFAQAPDEARALLLAALPLEPAKAQEIWLEILAQHLHPDAEPLLESLVKARGQDVRRRATELLVQLPGAALTERLWARAAPLLTARRKLLGLGKVVLEVSLPDSWDKSWLLDGIEEKNARFLVVQGAGTNTPLGPATARLANLLALLPPQRWTAHLGLTPPELLTAALVSEWAMPLLSAWAQSTLLHRNEEMAAAFLALWLSERAAWQQGQLGRRLDWVALAALLAPAARQQLLLGPVIERVRQQAPEWANDVELIPAPWPRALSQAVLAALHTQLIPTLTDADVPYQLRQLVWQVVQALPARLAPADAAWAIQQAETFAETFGDFQPQFQALADELRFQSRLEASLTE